MLKLYSQKYQNVYSRNTYYINGLTILDCGHKGSIYLQNHNYRIRSAEPLIHADLPLKMHEINLSRLGFYYDKDIETQNGFTLSQIEEGIKDKLLDVFNDTTNDQIVIITGFICDNSLSNKDYEYSFIDKDLWKEHKDDGVISLYNKCVEQTSLRESERQARSIQQHLRLFQSRTKHIVLMLTDYQDADQESETYLTLGLTPVLFEDLKEKFEALEIEYFKTLVNRSQVKRISNVKAEQAFKNLEAIELYHTIERTIRYNTLFEQVANTRIRLVESNARQYKVSMESALQSYDSAVKKLQDAELLIEKYKEGTADIIEELKEVSKTNGVYDIQNYDSSKMKLILRVPLDYFDTDEAECAIRNIQNSTVKRFLTELFIEQKYKLYIRTDAYYTYTSEGNFQDFGPINDSDFRSTNALFNPHFQYFHCLGNYKPELIKAMRNQDLIMYTNIAVAAARSINFKDGAVMRNWISWLADVFNGWDFMLSIKCLEKDGKLYTLKQWLTNNFDEEDAEEINVIEAEDL